MGAAFGGGPPSSSSGAGTQGSGAGKDRKMASAEQLVLELSNPELRENALLELSKVSPYKQSFLVVFQVSASIFCSLNCYAG